MVVASHSPPRARRRSCRLLRQKERRRCRDQSTTRTGVEQTERPIRLLASSDCSCERAVREPENERESASSMAGGRSLAGATVIEISSRASVDLAQSMLPVEFSSPIRHAPDASWSALGGGTGGEARSNARARRRKCFGSSGEGWRLCSHRATTGREPNAGKVRLHAEVLAVPRWPASPAQLAQGQQIGRASEQTDLPNERRDEQSSGHRQMDSDAPRDGRGPVVDHWPRATVAGTRPGTRSASFGFFFVPMLERIWRPIEDRSDKSNRTIGCVQAVSI